MGQLPEDRTTQNTSQEHVEDHNELHRLHNLLEGEELPARVQALEDAPSGASRLFISDPVTVHYNDANVATTGVDLFTTQAGDMLFGAVLDIETPFDSGETAFCGTPNMISDFDPIGSTGPYNLAVPNFTAPGLEGSYYPTTAFDGPNHWITPTATVVRFKIVTGGNAAGQVKVRVVGYHDMD
jgi:hypothetical protein